MTNRRGIPLPNATSIEQVRADVAAGIAAAAAVWRANSHLRGAAEGAAIMEARAAAIRAGASICAKG